MNGVNIDDIHIEQHFVEFPQISQLFDNMENRESWTLDGDYEMKKKVQKFAQSLTPKTISDLDMKAKWLLVVLGVLGAKRSFFLLNRLSELNKTLVNSLASEALSLSKDPDFGRFATIFLDRLRAVNSEQLLPPVLGDERLSLIMYTINQTIAIRGGL